MIVIFPELGALNKPQKGLKYKSRRLNGQTDVNLSDRALREKLRNF